MGGGGSQKRHRRSPQRIRSGSVAPLEQYNVRNRDEFTIADISVGPWIERIVLLLEKDFFGKYDKGTVVRVFEAYKSSKYDKLRNWNRRVQERPGVKKTFLKVSLKCYRYVRVSC